MLYTNGAIITDVRGSIGGQTYSKNRYGKFVCNKYSPTNMRTAAQQQNRILLAQSVYNWRHLSEHERLSWNSAAMYLKGTNCFGDSFSYTAYQCYIKCSTVFLAFNNYPLETCPIIYRPASYSSFKVVINAEQQVFNLSYVSNSSTSTYSILYATRPLNPGRKPKESDFRRILLEPSPYPVDNVFTDAYIAYFGSFPTVGKVVYFRLCSVAPENGLLSSTLTASAVCSSYLQDITPYNMQQASFNPATKVLSLNASTSAFAALCACSPASSFSLRFRILTTMPAAYLRINFSYIDTPIGYNDNRNKYRLLPTPNNNAFLFNILGATVGGCQLQSIYNYIVLAYKDNVFTVFSGSSPDNLSIYGSIYCPISGIGYITISTNNAYAIQLSNLAYSQ